MRIDSTAAVYGLFHVVFADMTDRLAAALFGFRQRREAGLRFEDMSRQTFKQMLDQFKDELNQFPESPSVSHDLGALRQACTDMSNIARWRNTRIHARVRQVDDGLALYDWRTGNRLSINYAECENKIQEAVKVIVALEAHVPHLVEVLDFGDLIEQLLGSADDVH